MDSEKTGALIWALRREQGLTQGALAQKLCVSDKAVSKWERGAGCPDISLLADIAAALGVGVQSLLDGALQAGDPVGGNMKKLSFYVCPQCGNIFTSTGEAQAICCGRPLEPLEGKKAGETEELRVEKIENDYFVSGDHPMTKTDYVSFVALLTGDAIVLRKLYPEWGLQTRIPCIGHGKLVWYSAAAGLLYQNV
ncbi:MAG: helix-turn-helix domain-containing protein [Oscillospiraceae bacterium]|nr:helix-turn-helix domain-containing protein [Oscillospiraceae bacterium]